MIRFEATRVQNNTVLEYGKKKTDVPNKLSYVGPPPLSDKENPYVKKKEKLKYTIQKVEKKFLSEKPLRTFVESIHRYRKLITYIS